MPNLRERIVEEVEGWEEVRLMVKVNFTLSVTTQQHTKTHDHKSTRINMQPHLSKSRHQARALVEEDQRARELAARQADDTLALAMTGLTNV